jgi:hypothetical protein
MNRFKNENGQALAVVVAIMVVGSVIMSATMGLLFASASSSGSTRDQVDAYYVADAGVEAVFAELIENGDGLGAIAGEFQWGGGSSMNGYQPEKVKVVDRGLVVPLPKWTYYSHDYEITSTAGGTTVVCDARYSESIWGRFVTIIEWSAQ